jgi:hypothetical protein
MYEEVSINANGDRVSKIFLGRLPTTRYQGSVWTQTVTQPIEAIVNDTTAQAWFGFERNAFTQDYVQDQDEAALVLQNRRAQALAQKVEVVRPDGPATVGDTVFLNVPEQGISRRFLIVGKRRDWTGYLPRATYQLEARAA